MKYFILCFSLIVLPLNASAEESRKPYWVVGSFDSMQGATDERRRLEYETGLPVQIATVNEGATFRIVIAKTAVSEAQLEIEGFEPWTLSFSESFLEIPLEDSGETGVMDYYLVLSSFKHADRAHSFADQVISSELQSVEVSMTALNDETLYRVVHGPFDQRVDSVRNSYNDIVGNDTWWILTARPEPAQSESVVSQKSELRGPEIGDSYVEYCGTKANRSEREAFCSDGQIEGEISKTAEFLSLNDRTYVTYCTQAPGKDRMKYCTDEFSDRRLGR
jgi:hypothetical protein